MEAVSLHNIRQGNSTKSRNPSRKAYQFNVCEEAVHFRREGSSNEDVLSHANYEGHGKILTRHALWTDKM